MLKLFVLVSLLLGLAAASGPAEFVPTSPLLLWSNTKAVGKGQSQQVSYEVILNLESVASNVVLGALDKLESRVGLNHIVQFDQLSSPGNTKVVIFVGQQLSTAVLRKHLEPVSRLAQLMSSAASSLVLPYAAAKGQSVSEAVSAKLAANQIQTQAVGCSEPVSDLTAEVSKALSSSAQLLLVCSQGGDLDQEVAELLAVQQAVSAVDANHLFMYTSEQSTAKQALASKKRTLLQEDSDAGSFTGFGKYTVCDANCQTQVRWLEGMLVLMLLAIMSCSGLVCLYMLNGPTRFEQTKEGSSQ